MARIGLLSDSHGRAMTTRRAVEILLEQNVEMLIHLGDVGSIEVLDALAVNQPDTEIQMPVRVVFGNTDYDRDELGRYGKSIGLTIDDPVGTLTVEGGELVFLHGDDMRQIDVSLANKVKYICHGHSHQKTDKQIGETRIINPGALHRASEYTVAVLDTAMEELTFFPVA